MSERTRTSGKRQPITGLARLAWAHSLASAGDALVTVSLAGSLFFSVSPDASRRQVLLYLVITMLPFSLIAPLIGPTVDRFHRGHRLLAVAFYVGRAGAALGVAFFLHDLALYFFALMVLVLNKASGIVKQALVPGLVTDPAEFVAANSRLARLATIGATIGGVIGSGLIAVTTPVASLGAGCAVFIAAAVAGMRIPPPEPDAHPTDIAEEIEYREVHTPAIIATSNAYVALRASVGFFVFGMAFALRRDSEPTWVYGAAVAVYGAGVFVGNMVAPIVRRRLDEERLMAIALAVLGICAGFGALGPSRSTVIFVAFVLGASASMGRQAFDALMQRRAPLAMRGRAFARFETLFQIGWVAGGAVATGLAVSIRVSMSAVLIILLPAAAWYVRSMLDAERFTSPAGPDPLASAKRHVSAANEWLAHGSVPHAAIEVAACVDLLRLSGVALDEETVTSAGELHRLATSEPGRGHGKSPTEDGHSVAETDGDDATGSGLKADDVTTTIERLEALLGHL